VLWLSYYCLCLLFNKIRDNGRTDSAWKQGGVGGDGGDGEQGEKMAQTIYAHINKWIKKVTMYSRKKNSIKELTCLKSHIIRPNITQVGKMFKSHFPGLL
jgi:hypothetical protein